MSSLIKHADGSRKIVVMTIAEYQQWLIDQAFNVKTWLDAHAFEAKDQVAIVIPGEDGDIASVVFILENKNSFFAYAKVRSYLPKGDYVFEGINDEQYHHGAIAWALDDYQFINKKDSRKNLVIHSELDHQAISNYVDTHCFARDLINRPANDLTPQSLAEEAKNLAEKFQAQYREIIGEALLEQNYPAIYAVGKASSVLPRLIDFSWGNESDPKITLVGKGVTFDTGGLDIKPSPYMGLMRKDMGGAAHVLALAKLIMQAQLPLRLRVLIPAVENSIAGNAMRPGDVLNTRKGLTVEVTDTDAEGRLVLADALYEASQDKPEMIIDFATLTGSARAAVGTDIAALFTRDDALARELVDKSKTIEDYVWQLPLHDGYADMLKSDSADLQNSAATPYAGATAAALFLEKFLNKDDCWLHFDLMAWNVSAKPGKPKGGEAMALRLMFEYLKAFKR
jgi:leucyl aminopeptidase